MRFTLTTYSQAIAVASAPLEELQNTYRFKDEMFNRYNSTFKAKPSKRIATRKPLKSQKGGGAALLRLLILTEIRDIRPAWLTLNLSILHVTYQGK